MNYLVENNYTEDTKAFLTECQAYNYMYEEIERLCSNTDKWFIGREAIDLGIVDKIVGEKE